jgi:hypothetical protein
MFPDSEAGHGLREGPASERSPQRVTRPNTTVAFQISRF